MLLKAWWNNELPSQRLNAILKRVDNWTPRRVPWSFATYFEHKYQLNGSIDDVKIMITRTEMQDSCSHYVDVRVGGDQYSATLYARRLIASHLRADKKARRVHNRAVRIRSDKERLAKLKAIDEATNVFSD